MLSKWELSLILSSSSSHGSLLTEKGTLVPSFCQGLPRALKKAGNMLSAETNAHAQGILEGQGRRPAMPRQLLKNLLMVVASGGAGRPVGRGRSRRRARVMQMIYEYANTARAPGEWEGVCLDWQSPRGNTGRNVEEAEAHPGCWTQPARDLQGLGEGVSPTAPTRAASRSLRLLTEGDEAVGWEVLWAAVRGSL